MTTTVDERKEARSVPWNNYLYPRLRDPVHAVGYLNAVIEEEKDGDCPPLLGKALMKVIQANKDHPFIAYQVICAYSHHLTAEDIPRLIETLQGVDQAHQKYLADLYLWLDMLKTLLPHNLHWLKIEARPLDVPDELKASEAYQQWAKVA